MVYYKPIKVNTNAPDLTGVIIDMLIKYHGLPDSIIINRGLLFTSKFWSLLCYFLGIKQRLFTAFHSLMDGQTERQNNTMETYLQDFVNFEQND